MHLGVTGILKAMDIIISLSTFVFGCIVGWYSNHWYSVNMREAKLSQNGGGGGSGIFGTSFHSSYISIQNELRWLGVNLPETIIFGKRLKTRFGGQIVERNPARECRAQILDESGKHICNLFWIENNKIFDTVDIKSGKSANLLLFIRKADGSAKFYVYQPTSQSDLTPKTIKVPSFSKSTNFLVRVTYSYNKSFSFPAGVEINYDENYYVTTKNGSGLF
jgi:hypothetical protein